MVRARIALGAIALCIGLSGCHQITAACLNCLRPGLGNLYLWCHGRSSSSQVQYVNGVGLRVGADLSQGASGTLSRPPTIEECRAGLGIGEQCLQTCEDSSRTAAVASQRRSRAVSGSAEAKRAAAAATVELIIETTVINAESGLTNEEERKCIEAGIRSCCETFGDDAGIGAACRELQS